MKLKKYKIKPTAKQMRVISEAWAVAMKDTDYYWKQIRATEKWLAKETGIKGVEFFWADGDIVGVCNSDRTMKLIHDYQLDKD